MLNNSPTQYRPELLKFKRSWSTAIRPTTCCTVTAVADDDWRESMSLPLTVSSNVKKYGFRSVKELMVWENEREPAVYLHDRTDLPKKATYSPSSRRLFPLASLMSLDTSWSPLLRGRVMGSGTRVPPFPNTRSFLISSSRAGDTPEIGRASCRE